MFIDNLLPVSPVCTKLDLSPLRRGRFRDLSPLRRGRFRGGHNLAPSAPTTDTCPLPSLPDSPYHGCRSGPCHIAGPNQDQPLRPVTCRDPLPPSPESSPSLMPAADAPKWNPMVQWYRIRKFRPFLPPPQPRILQPSLACCRRPKMERNGTKWYRIRKFRPFLPPLQPRILQPSLACCRCPKMERNGTEWYRIRKFRPFLPPAASSAHHRRCSHPASSRTLLRHRTRHVPYRWLQDNRFRHELTRLRPNTADLARYELRGLMLRCLDMSTNYPTLTIPASEPESRGWD